MVCVFRAIANVLHVRIVIYRGETALSFTEVLPSIMGPDLPVDGTGQAKSFQDITLGHLAEAHYVSLRKTDWKDTLIKGMFFY